MLGLLCRVGCDCAKGVSSFGAPMVGVSAVSVGRILNEIIVDNVTVAISSDMVREALLG